MRVQPTVGGDANVWETNLRDVILAHVMRLFILKCYT